MKRKACSVCENLRPLSQFHRRAAATDGRAAQCRGCKSQMQRKYIGKISDAHRERVRKQKAEYRRQNRKYVLDYLRDHPCEVCGENDVRVLEFAHVDAKTKRANVGTLISECYSLKTVMDEIAKCRVLCANCHRRETTQQLGWYRGLRGVSGSTARS